MAAKSKGYKFATLKAQAEKRTAGREKRKLPAPFVIDDVDPPIVITAPDNNERLFGISEILLRGGGLVGPGDALPMMRFLCGDQFPRVWALVKDDTEPDIVLIVVQAIVKHFEDQGVIDTEAADLPGGSEGSSSS